MSAAPNPTARETVATVQNEQFRPQRNPHDEPILCGGAFGREGSTSISVDYVKDLSEKVLSFR